MKDSNIGTVTIPLYLVRVEYIFGEVLPEHKYKILYHDDTTKKTEILHGSKLYPTLPQLYKILSSRVQVNLS